MTTLRPTTSLWRRTRTTMLAASIALGSVLMPTGAGVLADAGTVATADGTSGASTFVWEGSSLEDATAIVSAGGQNLNLRAEPSDDADVVTKIPHGTVIALRIAETDTVLDAASGVRWWPVSFGGQTGWVSGNNLVDGTGLQPGMEPYEFPGGDLAGATAEVRASAGLRLRAEASADSKALVTIPNGTVVELRIAEADSVLDPDGVTRWWPVRFNGQDGWVSGYYLVAPGAASTATMTRDVAAQAVAGPTEQFEWTGSSLEGATAIANGFGQNVNVRADANEASEIVAKVPDGNLVNLRIDRVDTQIGPDGETRWWPVTVDGVEGWISGFYLTDGAQGVVSSDIFPAGSIAMVQTPTGEGLRLRVDAGMDAEAVTSLPDRSQVTVLGGPVSFENSTNGWFQVRSESGLAGYVDGDLLILIATPVAEPATSGRQPAAPTPTPAPASDGTEGQPSGDTELVPEETELVPAAPTPTPAPSQNPDGDDTAAPTPTVTAVPGRQQSQTPTPTPAQDAPTPTPRPTQPPAQSSSEFILPVPGSTLTQQFGCSSLGFYPYNPDWGCGVHDGIDYAAPAYTPILAVADGTVVTAGWCDCGLGYYVEIDHGGGLHTIYGHMASQPYVSVGQRVTQGETIGPVGSTGLSTGPHVHFMVQVNGITQDPNRYLP